MKPAIFYLWMLTFNQLTLIYSQKGESNECGISPRFDTSVNLKVARIKEAFPTWPWVAALLHHDGPFCGGVLIGNQFVLTAANCLQEKSWEEITVRLGEHDFQKKNGSEWDSPIDRVFVHPKFDGSTLSNNLALIRIKNRIPDSDAISHICPPPRDLFPEVSSGYVAGWRSSSLEAPLSQVMLELRVPIWAHDDCLLAYPQGRVASEELCAGFSSGASDSCVGDSGGPLMLRLPSGQWTVVGIVSGGRDCGVYGQPGLYTRLVKYWDWIQSTSSALVNDKDKSRSGPISSPIMADKLRTDCGMKVHVTSFIGGFEPFVNEWPWMASLRDSSDGKHFCGGVLIGDQYILTAAHCLSRTEASAITIRLGEHDFNETSSAEMEFSVQKIYKHNDYAKSRSGVFNDIAVLKLRRQVTFTNEIRPICLPPDDFQLEDYQESSVIGWGALGFDEPSSNVLQEGSLPWWDIGDCQKVYPDKVILGSHICAGLERGGVDSCQGDSGGPMMNLLPDGRWAVVGIVSVGVACGTPNKPGIYTRVSSFNPWIESTIANDKDD